MLLFSADDERLTGKKAHATDYALAESKARAFEDVLSALPPMSITNVNKHLGCLYGLFAWARKHAARWQRRTARSARTRPPPAHTDRSRRERCDEVEKNLFDECRSRSGRTPASSATRSRSTV